MRNVVAGRFELIDVIGSGSAGTVWRAWDAHECHYCAAKLIEQTDTTELVRAVREQSVRVRHPHVVSPSSWAAQDGLVVIASDLVHGGSLATLLADFGPLPWRYVAAVGDQLLDALGAVHAAGLVHRDVKPSNVLLAAGAEAPHVRLTDFGIAHLVDAPRVTRTGFVVGTPGYLAPEVTRTGHRPDSAQDLYAAGVLLWQLLAGDEQPQPLDEARRPAGLPQRLWTVLCALLERDPKWRPPDAAAARSMLAPVLESAPLHLPARTQAGEPIEVFDQVGSLPQGWVPGQQPHGDRQQ